LRNSPDLEDEKDPSGFLESGRFVRTLEEKKKSSDFFKIFF
jgi:hypothetical protein